MAEVINNIKSLLNGKMLYAGFSQQLTAEAWVEACRMEDITLEDISSLAVSPMLDISSLAVSPTEDISSLAVFNPTV